MRCSHCGLVNAIGSKFCRSCGYTLGKAQPVYATLAPHKNGAQAFKITMAAVLGLVVGGIVFLALIEHRAAVKKAAAIVSTTPAPVQEAPPAPTEPGSGGAAPATRMEQRAERHAQPRGEKKRTETVRQSVPAVGPAPVPPAPVPPPATADQPAAIASVPTHKRRAVQENEDESAPMPMSSTDASGNVTPPGAGPQSAPTSSGQEPILHRHEGSTGTGDDRPVLKRHDAPAGSAEAGGAQQTGTLTSPAGQPTGAPYAGPMTGVAVWTGKLNKDDTLSITGGTASTGTLEGTPLPNVQLSFTIDQKDLGIAQWPSASNGYRLVLKTHKKLEKITIHWSVVQ